MLPLSLKVNAMNHKPKLLYIVTQAQWGGAQRYVSELANALQGEFEVTIATGRREQSEFRISNLESRNKELKNLVREINPLRDILAIFEIANFLKKEKFDLVHLNSSKAGFIGALANVLAGRPSKVVYTAHGWVYLEPLPWLTKKFYLWLERLAAGLREATIVLGETEKQVALKYGTARANSLAVIPQGLDFSKLQFLPREEARAALGLETNAFILGTIANNYPTKGLKYFDEALQKIKFQIPQLRQGFDGQASSKFQAAIIGESFGSKFDNLLMLGHKDEAYQYLKAFDIFVLPSVKEGFPFVLLEALAAGLPIVATAVGAIPEIVANNKSGLLVPPADSEALAEAIQKLLVNENLRQQLGAGALERSKNFDFQNTLEKTKSLYSLILKIR